MPNNPETNEFSKKAAEKASYGGDQSDPLAKLLEIQERTLAENTRLTEAKIREAQATEANLTANERILEETERKTQLMEESVVILTDLSKRVETDLLPQIDRLQYEIGLVTQFMEILLQFLINEYSNKGNAQMVETLTKLLAHSKQSVKVYTDDVSNAGPGNLNFTSGG